MVCEIACEFFLGVNPAMSTFETLAWMAVVTGGLCFGVAFWTSGTMNALADPATDIFRKLGFADPEDVNLNSYQYGIVHIHELLHSPDMRANYANIHCYKKAVEDGKLKLAN